MTVPPHRDDHSRMTFRITKDGKEIWAEIMYEGAAYYLPIVERQTMQQDVAANADALRDGLTQNGHVEVPGIFFDFAKSEIRPESEPALKELANLLGNNPSLRVWVAGHTDNIGSAERNVTLANARAAAVVKAPVQSHGINATRLASRGVGPYAPVATNTTDEGRARNRRVELVAQPSRRSPVGSANRSPEGLVFATRHGGPMVSNNLRKRGLQSACKRAGLPRINWHSLRHTHGTLLHVQGTPLKVAQAATSCRSPSHEGP
jgi:outer membrane protein OmpA-like peptidoglycan-associated protein